MRDLLLRSRNLKHNQDQGELPSALIDGLGDRTRRGRERKKENENKSKSESEQREGEGG